MSDNPEMLRLKEVNTQFEAELLVGALRNEGIEAHSDSESPSMHDPLASRGARVYVAATQLEDAKAVLEQLDSVTARADDED